MKVAVRNGQIVMSSSFQEGNWPLDVWEKNIPCTCGYTGEGEITFGFPACNDRINCPVCGKDLDEEVEKVLHKI